MTSRPLPPPLEFDDPPCSICGEDTYLEEGEYLCEPCGASWDAFTAADKNGGWEDDDAEQCPSETRPWADAQFNVAEWMRERTYRCVRAAGHKGKHTHPEWQHGWKDGA